MDIISLAEKIKYVGANMHFCSNSGSAMTGTGVLEIFKNTLRYKTELVETNSLLKSVCALLLVMAKWLLGVSFWPLGVLGSTHAFGVRRPEEDIGSFWMRIHRMGHQCVKQHNTSPVSTFRVQKHRMARHFARLDDSHIVANLLHCRDLSWWREQLQKWEVNGNGWGGVHPACFACWRCEQDLELSYGRSTRNEGANAINVGWKATAQSQPEWTALEQRF